MNESMKLRKAVYEDMELLFCWANETECRNNSFHPEPIVWEEHSQWFSARLKDDKSDIFIYCYHDKPIGMVRVDYRDEGAEISYSISIGNRGQGHGSNMLQLLEQKLCGYKLVAEVKKSNVASQLVFERLGYHKYEGEELITYKKEAVSYKVIDKFKCGMGGGSFTYQ